jgi:hypothetical protein
MAFVSFQEALHGLVVARHLDHVGHFHDRVDVRIFQHALRDLAGGLGRRLGAGVKDVVRTGEQGGAVRKVDDVELADHLEHLAVLCQVSGDRAVLAEKDRAVIGIEGHAAAARQDWIAVAGDQGAVLIQLEAADPGVAHTLGGLDGEEAVALDCQVEVVAGRSQGTGREIAGGGEVLYIGQLRALLGRNFHFRHEHHFGLEARGVCVGEVVRHHIHLVAQDHLSRKRDVSRCFHDSVP